MEKALRASVLTLGCRVNQYESDYIMEELKKSGVLISSPGEKSDIYIINTCSVTQESDRKSRQLIRRCIKENKDALIIVTGCFSEINPEEAQGIEGVDIICGNNIKSKIPKLALTLGKESYCRVEKSDIYSGKFDTMMVGAPLSRTRAFIKIEDGCDSKCAYCIIPRGRGSVRSNPKENVLSEVRNVSCEGCLEVVLTGIETASYGKDFENNYTLADLLCEVNEVAGIERIRLGSLDPVSVNKEFVDKIKSLDKVMPHFHLSMQSGCTKTLNSMKRKYNIDIAKRNIDYLREQIPNVMLSADVITGFPGEENEDFQKTLEFFKNERFLHLHIFPYSKRSGTLASVMPNQVPDNIKKERLHMLEALQKDIKRGIFEDVILRGEPIEVLFESVDKNYICGHSKEFFEVKAEGLPCLCGTICKVMPKFTDGEYIYGEII